jgi:DMSO/TMAO reductase YedYZ heme-binding membrane subunit
MTRGERPSAGPVAGWPLVGWSTLVLAAMVAGIVTVAGGGEPGVRMVVRATARTSVALFTLAFVAAALHRRWPGATTRWLLANRRYLGVSFAVSHFLHLAALLALAGWSPRRFASDAGAGVLVFAGLGYAFLAAMTATSFDTTAAWLGPRRWKRLHTLGSYDLWLIFTVSYVPRAFSRPLIYGPFAVALIAALVLRLAPLRRQA